MQMDDAYWLFTPFDRQIHSRSFAMQMDDASDDIEIDDFEGIQLSVKEREKVESELLLLKAKVDFPPKYF